jgi:cyclopropane fatty-acyl-phospholipid synthase-like methyltransferase
MIADSADFEQRHHFGNAEANLRFLEESRIPVGSRLLEIGSGRGALLHHLLASGFEISGLETSAERIRESRDLYGSLPIQRVEGVRIPFADESFDVVLSFDVFEHIRDSDGHLKEVARVLVTGGRYLFQTPNKWTNTVFETIRWRSLTSWRADHCALHTYRQLRHRLERHGFEVKLRDVPVVTAFFRQKLRHYLGPPGPFLLRIVHPDRLPLPWRTNFYVEATKKGRTDAYRLPSSGSTS